MNQLSLIIKREYITKVRNRAFIIMTFLSPLIMVGLITLVTYLSQLNNDKVRVISVLDESGLFVDQLQDENGLKYEKISGISLSEAKKQVEESDNYGLLYIAEMDSINALVESITFYSEDSPSLVVMREIEDAIEAEVNTLKMKEAGFDPDEIRALRVRVNTKLETFGGEKTSKLGSGLKLVFGGLAGYLLFMFIIIYGNMIMRSVIEEKTSRIIEVIISSVKPIKLLMGKIIGTSLAGITQILVWVLLMGIFSLVISMIFGIDIGAMQQQEVLAQVEAIDGTEEIIRDILIEIKTLPIANLIIMFIFFFLGGFLLYASLYAAVGAAVDNETDTQQFILPLIAPLILAVYVGFFTVIDNPHGTVSQIFSFIPFTSPVVMLMRIPFGVPLWQQILSVLILFATFMGTVWFAAKIYRVGILMYGKKASYKELIKWLKY